MRKALKSRIFTFILGALIFGSIGVVSAHTILANDIGYTPKDTTWKKSNGEDITNVSEAIDELYNKTIKEPNIYFHNKDGEKFNNRYMDFDYVIDWNKNFKIEMVFSVASTSKRYLLVGGYDNSHTKELNLEIYNDSSIRVYIGKSDFYVKYYGSIYANEDIKFVFSWDANTKTYNITANGENTNIQADNKNDPLNISGKANNKIRIGSLDYRSQSSPYSEIEIKMFSID